MEPAMSSQKTDFHKEDINYPSYRLRSRNIDHSNNAALNVFKTFHEQKAGNPETRNLLHTNGSSNTNGNKRPATKKLKSQKPPKIQKNQHVSVSQLTSSEYPSTYEKQIEQVANTKLEMRSQGMRLSIVGAEDKKNILNRDNFIREKMEPYNIFKKMLERQFSFNEEVIKEIYNQQCSANYDLYVREKTSNNNPGKVI